jgi:hypothetical protein
MFSASFLGQSPCFRINQKNQIGLKKPLAIFISAMENHHCFSTVIICQGAIFIHFPYSYGLEERQKLLD